MKLPGSYLFSVTLSIVVLASDSPAQWTQTNGPYAASVSSCAVIVPAGGLSVSLYVGTFGGGIFRSTDQGKTWSNRTDGIPTMYIYALASKDSILFAGTYGQGAFRSSDGGTSWMAINQGLGLHDIMGFAFDRSYLFASTQDGGGVFRSSDNGDNWVAVNVGLPSTSFSGIGCGDGHVSVASSYGVYVSSDEGAHWTSGGWPGVEGAVSVLAADSVLFGGGGYTGLHRSTDWGASWTIVSAPSLSNVLMATPSKVYASAASGLFQSTDSGVTWQILNSTIAAKTLTAFPDSKAAGDVALIAGTGTGAFLSVDGGITWSPSSNGLVGCRVLSLVSITDVHGMVVTCAGTDGMGAFLSTDVGVSWTPASGEIASSHVMALIAGKMGGIMPTLFAGAGEGIFQYDQAAGTWARMKTDSITYDVQTLVADGDSLVAGTWMGVFCLSADSVWRKRKSGWIDAMASDNEYLYAARGNVVSRSSDHGFHWEQAGGSLPAAITSMLSTPISGNGSPVLWGTTYNAGIMRSTDRGTSWSAMNGGLPDPKPEALCAARVGSGDGTLLVGTSLGMYRFDANAALWQPVSEGLPSTSVYACAENGGYTLAGTDRGVWRRPVSDLTAIANRGFAGPEVFFLSQNYPNPFNPVTMIRYELAERAPVTLTVYSVIGQFVSRLVNKIEGAGYHEVRFDASGLASGVYFYRLQAGSFVQSKKLVILK